jgi:methylenetetrahydrofolate dehydrogenase (NADP+)/methenyltetrahydrofolate cyclohydrolase
MAITMNGRALSRARNQALRARIAALPRPPGLAVILVGADPASQVYVGRKGQVATRLGLHHRQIYLPADTPQAELLALIDRLNVDPGIDGVLVQVPLPPHMDRQRVLDRIDPAKDVDGFHPWNMGLLAQGRPRFVACTPAGVMALLAEYGVPLEGKRAVVVGRSTIVGRPVSLLLDKANATVTVCHSRTLELEALVRRADIVVAAVGRPGAVPAAWIKPGAAVIDVGVNRLDDGSLVGDVGAGPELEAAGWLTPVPGGVGPMTIAMLMANTVASAERRLAD